MLEEREINLLDLFVEALYRWKMLVVCMIIGTIFVGCFGYYKSYQDIQNVEEETEAEEEIVVEPVVEPVTPMTDTSYSTVEQLLNNEASLAEYQKYFRSSILMQIDPFHAPMAKLIYHIHTSGSVDAATLSALYVQSLNMTLGSVLATACDDLSESQAMELFSVNNIVYVSDTPSNDATLTITLYHANTDICTLMADAVTAYIDQLVVTPHTSYICELVSQNQATDMNPDIITNQNKYRNTISDLKLQISAAKDKLTTEERKYYDRLKQSDLTLKEILLSDTTPVIASDEETKENPIVVSPTPAITTATAFSSEDDSSASEVKAPASPGFSLKYFMLGLLLGAFLHTIIVAVIYIASPAIRYTEDTQSLFGAYRIGAIPNRKRWSANPYTRFLQRLRDHGSEEISATQALNVASVNIRSLIEKKSLSSLCIVGSNINEFSQAVCDNLISNLSNDALQIGVADNILTDASALKTFGSYDGIVLLEKAGQSKYDDIKKELQLIASQEKALLGMVVME